MPEIKIYDKLVRDRIPEIIEKSGRKAGLPQPLFMFSERFVMTAFPLISLPAAE